MKWFNPDKGSGFIDPDDGKPEIFVHYRAVQGRGYRTVQAGQRVEYHTMLGACGPQQRPADRDRTADRPHGRTAGPAHGQPGRN